MRVPRRKRIGPKRKQQKKTTANDVCDVSERGVEHSSESDDDRPLSAIVKCKSVAVSQDEPSSSKSDSEDDQPLSSLVTCQANDRLPDNVENEEDADFQYDQPEPSVICADQSVDNHLENTGFSLPSNWLLTPCGESSQAIKLRNVNGYPVTDTAINLTPELQIKVHQKSLPPSHPLYAEFSNVPLSEGNIHQLVYRIDQFNLCSGNPDERFKEVNIQEHRAYVDISLEVPTVRDIDCALLIESGSRCNNCSRYRNSLRAVISRKSRAKDNVELPSSCTPLVHLNADQLRQRLQARTRQTKNLRVHISRLESRLEQSISNQGVNLDEKISEDLKQVVTQTENPFEAQSFAALFWEQQLKAAQAKDVRGIRWHPMMIRWALSVKFKSTAAYQTLRNSGCLKLPSLRTLRDYTNTFDTTPGFQPQVFQMLLEEKEKLGIENLHVTLLQDEVKLQSDLVYNKHTGELIGFVDIGDVSNSMNDFERSIESGRALQPEVATHMIVFMVRGLVHKFEWVIGHHPCSGIKAHFLYPILWEAVELLELSGIAVLCITCDGASPNRKFFKMHDTDENIAFKTENLYAEEIRAWLYFIADPPHLIKTTRNCFSNSFGHLRSRGLWRNGQFISWQHIVALYEHERNNNLKLAHKLTRCHVFLTSFARMRVSFATQVLSESVARALEVIGGDQYRETIKFVLLMDKFFDCMNVRSLNEGERRRKSFLKPYTSVDDERFVWLLDVFLTELFMWKQEVTNRPGNFSKSDRARMILSYQTLQGLEVAVRSFVESCRFLLSNGAAFILSERYNQDPLEQWFSLQRSAGGANTNPTVQQFHYNAASLRLQRSLACAPFTGNCRTNQDRNVIVDNNPLAKRKR